MLSLNLTPIFKARGIERPFSFLVKAGLSPHSANAVLNSTTKSFRLDHIELLCRTLICEPNDLLLWTPDKDKQYSNDHPLFKLQQQDSSKDMKETMATIPYKQLKEITKQINNVE
jgi:DNA-binding Xre family transcriptional regulator